ncbi:uncharacterized protein [Porites lutea]|uniref:uncharacterized protein isoform X1 n=1 Tax=Porites lutea TaxID=51062 RepID=UPI003CC62C89
MNSKKAKRSKEESLLIAYNSGNDRCNRSSESDTNVPPLDLPPTRLRRPKSRKLQVTPQSKACYSPWNALQVIFVLFTLATMFSMMWFTFILKTSLETMKKRVTSLESFDRSTTREYGDLSKDISSKYDALKKSENEVVKQENEHYKSILKQIAHLNLTVNDLQKRVESPESANKITGDIQLLKKGMADTGGDITEVKDKIKQLTDLAGKQNDQVNTLTNKFFNLSVQLAQVMGQPTPEPPKNTGTPPLILRMPISSDERAKPEEKLTLKNVSAIVSVEVARIMGIVSSVNHTLSHEVNRIRFLMKNLLEEVKKYVATLDDVRTKVSHVLSPNSSSIKSRGPVAEEQADVSEQLLNLTVDVTKISEAVHRQSRKLTELMLEMVQVNRTVNDHRHIEAIQEKSVICNCSSEVGKLWEELSKNRLDMQSMQQKLQMLQTPVKQNEPEVTPAPANLEASVTVTQNQSLSETDKSDKELEQEEEAVEDVMPHLTPGSNVTYSDEKATDAPLASSSHVNASSVLHSALPTNSTSSSTATTTLTSSLVNQTSTPASKVEVEVVKISTPSSDEAIEDSLEDNESESN